MSGLVETVAKVARTLAGTDTAGLVKKRTAEKEEADRELAALITDSVRLREAYYAGTGPEEDALAAERSVVAKQTQCDARDAALSAATKAHEVATTKAAEETHAKEQAGHLADAGTLQTILRGDAGAFVSTAEKLTAVVAKIDGFAAARFDIAGTLAEVAREASKGAARVVEVHVQPFGVRVSVSPKVAKKAGEYQAFLQEQRAKENAVIAKNDRERRFAPPASVSAR